MSAGLVIKKRQGNGVEQTVNKYMIFSSPKEDLKEKNKKQMDRELQEYRDKVSGNLNGQDEVVSQGYQSSNVRKKPGSVREYRHQ